MILLSTWSQHETLKTDCSRTSKAQFVKCLVRGGRCGGSSLCVARRTRGWAFTSIELVHLLCLERSEGLTSRHSPPLSRLCREQAAYIRHRAYFLAVDCVNQQTSLDRSIKRCEGAGNHSSNHDPWLHTVL